MPTVSEAFAIAVKHHHAGELQTAERIYREILAIDPNHADALHLLGVVASKMGQYELAAHYMRRAIELNGSNYAFHSNLGNALRAQGKLDEAVGCYRRALELNPHDTATCNNLGNVFRAQGKQGEAVACFRQALELKPDFVEVHVNLGNAFLDQGKFEEAVESYGRALQLKPDYALVHFNLGNAFKAQDRLDEAVACYRRAVELNSDFAEAHTNLGWAYQTQGRLGEAVACCRRALDLKPDDAMAHFNLGSTFHDQGKLDESVACFRRAIELKPDHTAAHKNLAIALTDQGNLDEAIECMRRALELKPNDADTHNNLGTAYQAQGNLDGAVACYRRALELEPDNAEVHNNHALVMLQRGEFERGWPEYEWRWKCKELRAIAPKRPPWDGSALSGRGSILLNGDYGFGDTLHFIRYAPLVKQRAGEVVLRCSQRLIPLLSRCRGIDRFIPLDDKLPECDDEVHLTSLPLAFRTTLESVPQEVPYLFADPELVEEWRSRLPAGEFRVGIAWQGNPEFKRDKTRSIPLVEFASLAEIEGVRLFSLQKGFGSEQVARYQEMFSVTELATVRDESVGAFVDTAAVIKNMDLVITSDTAIAHLAGGLGARVWVALSQVPEWRWLLDRADSPWYPTMRLFRQTSRGNWPSVFEQMKAALSDRLLTLRTN